MKKIKVLSIFGTRPEAIKMAPLVKELEKREETESIVCVTAQHREMLDVVLKIFKIKPDYDLNIMERNQTLTTITNKILIELDSIVKNIKPDIILVHGDTSTAFVSALVAFYNQIPIGHVEAGLRTYNKYSPYPEEMNRQMIDCMCDIYFAPTELSKKNLVKEGKDLNKIFVTGNTAIDALKTTVNFEYKNEIFDWVGKDKLILLTAHRRENIGEPMKNMFKAIKRIIDEYSNIKLIYPIHMNPKVREIAEEIFKDCDKIKLIEPLDVLDFHNFLNKSYLILTDSGGIQEEAPSLGKPVLVLRDTTERPEGVEAGTLKLVGTDEELIYSNIKLLLDNKEEYEKMSKASNPYGDGSASKKIVDNIIIYFNKKI
ncbi:MAG: non-hydrolyzing UDP-N-acetylglucosamine 2-epimerase [Candidatus Scatovivens sp.]